MLLTNMVYVRLRYLNSSIVVSNIVASFMSWLFSPSHTHIPESGWSLWGIQVTCESIEGMFRAAGLHLGPGINAATGGERHDYSLINLC